MSHSDVPVRFLELAERARGPKALSEAGLRERFGDPVEVVIAPAQVWRARWNEISLLVLIIELAGRDVLATPVTIDPPAEDEQAVVLDGPASAFGVECTVWVGLTTTVPVRVLDRVMDVWPAEIVNWTAHAAQGEGGPLPAGVRPGVAICSELEPAAQIRAELADELDALKEVPGLPVESPSTAPRDLASLLGSKLDLATLCTALGRSQAEVMRMLRGKDVLTPEQVETVAQATGLSAEQIAGTVRPLPSRLVAALEHPRWRAEWTRRARRSHATEEQVRLSAGYKAFGLAARETSRGEPDWDARLRRVLHEDDDPAGGR